MFEVNDTVMYGTVGACQVVDITKEKFSNSIQREYYVLNPIYSKNTIIKIPVDNDKIAIRKMLSKDDANLLIKDMSDKEALWIEDEKKRNEQFKIMLKTGKCEELITLIKSIYLDKKNKKSIGKKVSKGDEEIMQTAEKLLNEEFSIVFNIATEEVTPYILSHVHQ